jgi:hypothetical protein
VLDAAPTGSHRSTPGDPDIRRALVVRAGYDAAFISLVAIALFALLVFLLIVPEIRRESLSNIGAPERSACAEPRR